MSFLNQVLSLADQENLKSLDVNLGAITSKIHDLRQGVETYFEQAHVAYQRYPETRTDLRLDANKLSHDMRALGDKLKEVTVERAEKQFSKIEALSNRLNASTVELNFTEKIIEVHEAFLKMQRLQDDDASVIEQAEAIALLQDLLRNVPFESSRKLFDSLKRNLLLTQLSSILVELDELWFENLVLSEKSYDNNGDAAAAHQGGHSASTVKIRRGYDFPLLLEVHRRLLGPPPTKIDVLEKLGTFVVRRLCEPIMRGAMTSVSVDDDRDFFALTVVVASSDNKNSSLTPTFFCDVLEKLTRIFHFFRDRFDHETDGSESTLSLLGQEVGQEMSRKLADFSRNIERQIIKSANEEAIREQFQSVIEGARQFNEEMKIFDITAGESLDKSTDQLESILIDAKCNGYLQRSIQLMKKDLYEFSEVAGSDKLDPLPIESWVNFRACGVSKSAIELVSLSEQLLEQSIGSSRAYVSRLLSTMRSVFTQYGDLVYQHHKKLIDTIPQQVALYHNNCQYLAYRLQLLDSQYTKAKFEHFAYTSVFAEICQELKGCGQRVLSEYVEKQVSQNEATLVEYGFRPERLSDDLKPDADKGIRQCIRQYELLKTTWRKVMAVEIYSDLMGHFLDRFCGRLIDVIVRAEDISSKNSEQLVDMFKIVLTRGPKLFDEPSETIVRVACWQKFDDMVFVLGARLIDIAARWAEGKGPLTLHFRPAEVRSLIKALFQNSETRDAVLSKICE